MDPTAILSKKSYSLRAVLRPPSPATPQAEQLQNLAKDLALKHAEEEVGPVGRWAFFSSEKSRHPKVGCFKRSVFEVYEIHQKISKGISWGGLGIFVPIVMLKNGCALARTFSRCFHPYCGCCPVLSSSSNTEEVSLVLDRTVFGWFEFAFKFQERRILNNLKILGRPGFPLAVVPKTSKKHQKAIKTNKQFAYIIPKQVIFEALQLPVGCVFEARLISPSVSRGSHRCPFGKPEEKDAESHDLDLGEWIVARLRKKPNSWLLGSFLRCFSKIEFFKESLSKGYFCN